MKTVSGEVVSTKTISLCKSAKVLSNFVAAETGASHAGSAYLRRASASFNVLVQFHKELEASKFDRKLTNDEDPVKYEQILEENVVVGSVEGSVGSHSGRKRCQQRKKRNEGVEREGGGSLVVEEGIRKKKKSGEVDDGEVVDSAEQGGSKKKRKKRRITEGED